MITAPVNRIISFSNVDGPGNRTSIFLQSCPFRCYYCHNPETIHYCINCGDCVKTCPVQALSFQDGRVVWNSDICVQCDTCIHVCKHLASPKIHQMSVEDVMEQIRKARIFIEGVTISGGECTNHPEFLTALFKEVHKLNLTCFLDSNGSHPYTDMPELMDVTDKVMLDVKAWDPQFHRQLCGADNEVVLNNLQWLLEHDKIYEVRTVLLNNHEQNVNTVSHVARIIKDKCYYKLIKYRPFGVREEGLKICGRSIVSDDELHAMDELAKSNGAIHTKIV